MSDIPALLERYRRGPEVLAMVLTGVFGEEEDFVHAPGKWSPRQIVAHLADAELVGAHRMRQVIAEDNPTLIAYDQDAWTRNLDYARRKPKQSLEAFRRIRAENYELLKELPESAFERTGNHSENGPMTLRLLLEGYAEHAESHARQLQHIRQEYKQAKGKK
jgi:DinB superfamily